MSPKWFIFLIIAFVALTFVSSLIERSYATAITATYLDTLFHPNWANPMGYLRAIWGAVSFDYSFWVGSWAYVRYIGMGISLGIGVAFVMQIANMIFGGIGGVLRR